MSHGRGPHLFDAALGGAEHVDEVTRDQNHGGQRHEPADHLAPQRVHVLPQGEGGHLDGTEGKHPLQWELGTLSPFSLGEYEVTRWCFVCYLKILRLLHYYILMDLFLKKTQKTSMLA